MNRYIIGILLLVTAFCLPVSGEPSGSDALAGVNDAVITRDSLQWATRHTGGFEPSSAYERREKALARLINRELLYQDSMAKGITVSDAEIKRHLNRLIKSLNTTQNGFIQKIGLPEEDINSEIRKDISIKKLLKQELPLVEEVSTREARAYYDDHPDKFVVEGPVHAYHILIKVSPGADDTTKAGARERIGSILEQLKNGADFSDLARKYSEDPSSIKGGDLGFVTRGQKYKRFENAVFSLVVGEVSGIVETPLGFHLITVTEKKPESLMEFEKVEKPLKQYLIKEKNQQLIMALSQNLRQKSVIKLFIQ